MPKIIPLPAPIEDIRFRVRRVESALGHHLDVLPLACTGSDQSIIEVFCRHSCRYCDRHCDHYLRSLVDAIVTGAEPEPSPVDCIISLVRAIALLANLYERSGQSSRQVIRRVDEFDASFPGTRALEWDFIDEDDLWSRFVEGGPPKSSSTRGAAGVTQRA
jgi:hypothetical protein